MRLGEYSPKHLPLERAREMGRFYRSLIDQGIDPRDYLKQQAERRAREHEEERRAEGQRRANTFAVVVEDYVAKYQVLKKDNRTWW